MAIEYGGWWPRSPAAIFVCVNGTTTSLWTLARPAKREGTLPRHTAPLHRDGQRCAKRLSQRRNAPQRAATSALDHVAPASRVLHDRHGGRWRNPVYLPVHQLDPDRTARFAGNPDGTVDVPGPWWRHPHGYRLWPPSGDTAGEGLERERELGHGLRVPVLDDDAFFNRVRYSRPD